MVLHTAVKKSSLGTSIAKYVKRDYQIYILLLPILAVVVIFSYIPMYGVIIAFKNFRFNEGILGSEWVGLQHFKRFVTMPQFRMVLQNTLSISLYSIAVNFPAPILLAIFLNECVFSRFKKTVQLVSYAPHFISTVVMCGMILLFLNRSNGMVNNLLEALGFARIDFMTEPKMFQSIFVLTELWQRLGWNSIIYLAALSSVDPQLIEACAIDGASRFQKIIHVDMPSLQPTIIILFILTLGSLLNVGFEKILLLQNGLNMPTSDVISTYVYRVGLINGQYSYTAAIGIFNSVVNFVLLVTVNRIVNKMSGVSLW